MRSAFLTALITAAIFCLQQTVVVGVAQVSGSGDSAGVVSRATTTGNLGATGGALSLGLTGGRRPFYRLQYSDTVELTFPFVPELNQSLTVQPDGYIALKGANSIPAEGKTLAGLQQQINEAYSQILHDPEVTVTLKEFDKPYFIVSGEVKRPGKYELRSETTVIEAVAIAGGFTSEARHSEVVLFRPERDNEVEARTLDIKKLLKTRALSEDLRLHPGDMIFVPQNTISKVLKYLPLPTTGVYINPTQF